MEGAKGHGDGLPRERGTSFVVGSVFDGWRARHPRWRVLARAELRSGMPMIEVPEIDVGGYRVGPVWFTRRDDREFGGYLNPDMDPSILGALGGSALQYFAVTVDYKRALAEFSR